MPTPRMPMFLRQFKHAGKTTRFSIRNVEDGGWEVREEIDRDVVRAVRYDDWHRVERARSVFALKASHLQEEGWVEV